MTAPGQLAEYPFTPRFLEVDGHRLAYLDEGSGPAVVMVHGNPSWSYLYRNLVSALRDRYRCIVPDHLGCGFSDKPELYPYRLRNHLDNLDHLLTALDPGPVRLVVHDWGGAIGMGWAGRHPEQVAGAVLLNTAAFPSPRLPLRIAVCRWPLLAALLVRGLTGKKLNARAGLAVLLLAALVVRVLLAFTVEGYGVDMGCFGAWAGKMADGGPANFYEAGYFCDYPPAYMLVLWLLGLLGRALGLGTGSMAFQGLMKLVPIACDLALAAVCF